jgi:SpoIID/LytB domain protein
MVVIDGRRYGGSVRVSGHRDGLAVVETVPVDDYLAGIQEVPLSWEPAALEAQVIAARTYLAWTLSRGRSGEARRLGYDICATDACQVYAGREPVLAPGGWRWREAIARTGGLILLYQGRPARAYYSSTSGGRTRTVSDVWPGIDLPYLVAVPSPAEDSPFTEWSWWLPAPLMERLLEEAGLIEGELESIETTVTADGEGPWTVTIRSSGGEHRLTTWELRGRINRAAAVLPDQLPAFRPDGRRYPQAVLSGTYTISSLDLPLGPLGQITLYRVKGRGWGHQVGMSQYGAQAMALAGAGAAEILGHYYGGLEPQAGGDWVPEAVEVLLASGAEELEVTVTGPVDVVADGVVIASGELGSWRLSADRGSLLVEAPVGLGIAPRLRPGRIGWHEGRWTVILEVTAAAEVSWEARTGATVVAASRPRPTDAGIIAIPLPEGAPLQVRARAENAHGVAVLVVRVPAAPG